MKACPELAEGDIARGGIFGVPIVGISQPLLSPDWLIYAGSHAPASRDGKLELPHWIPKLELGN